MGQEDEDTRAATATAQSGTVSLIGNAGVGGLAQASGALLKRLFSLWLAIGVDTILESDSKNRRIGLFFGNPNRIGIAFQNRSRLAILV